MSIFLQLPLQRLLLLISLLLPVWLSSLSIAHAMEIDNEIHQQHQCELYDVINLTLIPSDTFPLPSDKVPFFQSFTTLIGSFTYNALPRTRSPPTANLLFTYHPFY